MGSTSTEILLPQVRHLERLAFFIHYMSGIDVFLQEIAHRHGYIVVPTNYSLLKFGFQK